ncbi:MAG: SpoIIE family protein phosphatase [Leptospirales bacterium]|jgi:sigma-B regulation protein RsbU (phosphoserine phosphatase)
MIEVKYGKRRVVSYRGNRTVVGGLTAKNKIDILLYISKEFANANNEEELYDRVLGLCDEIFEVDNVTLRSWDGTSLKPLRSMTETEPPRRALTEGEGYSGQVVATRTSQLITDLTRHPELTDDGESTQCVVVVPILYKDSFLGTISIEKDIPHFYKDDDLEILEAMASQLGLAMNEVRLIEGLIDAQKRINDDLKMGRIVQGQIIQSEIQPWNSIHFGSYYEPMVEVSGDYFDVIRKGNSVSILAADVSGHGVSAALVTVTIHHEFRRCVDAGMGLPEIMEELGESIRPKLPAETYFTVQIIRIYADHSYSFVNGGHNHLIKYVKATNAFEQIDAPGIPLGIMQARREDYPEVFGKLNPGDILVTYTDGLTEQRNEAGEEAGLERLLYWLHEQNAALTEAGGNYKVSDLCSGVVDRWRSFVGNVPRGDDVNIVMATCNPNLPHAQDAYREARKSLKAGNNDRALSHGSTAYELEPSLHDNLLLLARLYYREQDYTATARYLEEYIESSGETGAQTLYMLGNVYYKSGDVVKAKREFKRALAIDHAFADASLMLARCYLKLQQSPKALRILGQAIKSNPGNEQIRAALASVEKSNPAAS